MQVTKAEVLSRIDEGWEKFQNYLASLSDEQLSQPTDAAGWTIKDHLIHIAVWENGIDALFNKESRNERMGIPDDLWMSGDYDAQNALIQQAHKDLSLEEVRQECQRIHEKLKATISSLSDEALNLPYQHYAPDSTRTEAVWGWIAGNTFGHYEEHQAWIAEIAAKA